MFKKKSFFILILLAVTFMTFNTSAVFAYDNTKSKNIAFEQIKTYSADKQKKLMTAINEAEFNNLKDFSSSELNFIKDVTKNPEEYLEFADLYEGKTELVYGTSNKNKKLAISNGEITIIEKVDEETYLLNDREVTVKTKLTVEDVPETSEEIGLNNLPPNWFKAGKPSGVTWEYEGVYTKDIWLEDTIDSFTFAQFVGIVSFAIGTIGGFVGAAASYVAGNVAGWVMAHDWSREARATKARIMQSRNHGPLLINRWLSIDSYIELNGQEVFAGHSDEYYTRMICQYC